MRKVRVILILAIIPICTISCSKAECQTCTKTISGPIGNITDKEKKICDEMEAQKLEESSGGTTYWECE